MGTEAPRWWRQLLDQLQVAAAEAAAVAHDEGAANQGWQPSNLQAIVDTTGDLHALPHTLPKAVWKKLLALQVLALATIRLILCLNCVAVRQQQQKKYLLQQHETCQYCLPR
jgi:hypothetical protein